jgi:hypothetical protein
MVRKAKYLKKAVEVHVGMAPYKLSEEKATELATSVASEQQAAWSGGYEDLAITYETEIKPILNERGIAGPLRAAYRAFYVELRKQRRTTPERAMPSIVDGLIAKYQAFGCDPSILSDIATAIGQKVPSVAG